MRAGGGAKHPLTKPRRPSAGGIHAARVGLRAETAAQSLCIRVADVLPTLNERRPATSYYTL